MLLVGGGDKLTERIEAGCKAGWVDLLCRIIRRVLRGTAGKPDGGPETDVSVLFTTGQALSFMCVYMYGQKAPAQDALMAAHADEVVAGILESKREEILSTPLVMHVLRPLVSRMSGIYAGVDIDAFLQGPIMAALPGALQEILELLSDSKGIIAISS